MIRKRTVFVLGAGASAPYGFPLGTRLLEQVASELLGGHVTPIGRDVIECGCDEQAVKVFGRELAACARSSIDAFLETRPRYSHVAKLAIARALIPHEVDVNLLAKVEGGWYGYLFDQMLGASPDRFKANQLSVVTFNFDRSFERALFLSLATNYEMSGAERIECARTIPVVHLHGQLGRAAWLGDPGGREYNGTIDVDQLKLCAEQIKIVHEEIDRAALAKAWELFAAAENVCFLGFGYHEINLARLEIQRLKGKSLYGTVYKVTRGPLARITTAFDSLLLALDVDVLKFLQETDVIHM